MADQPISKLAAHTVPTGSDELAIVSGGVTKKITHENLLSNSLFYSNAGPAVIHISESNDVSPLRQGWAALGGYPAAPSGSTVYIQDQYTKVLMDSKNSTYDDRYDVVIKVGDQLPGNIGNCIIEFESTGSATDIRYQVWYDAGGSGSWYEPYEQRGGYKPLGISEYSNNSSGIVDFSTPDWSFYGGQFSTLISTTFNYTRSGQHTSGSFYQSSATGPLVP